MLKTISFGIMHISVAFLVIWAITGDWRLGGITAMVEPLINTLAYHVHEKVWRKSGGRQAAPAQDGMVSSAY